MSRITEENRRVFRQGRYFSEPDRKSVGKTNQKIGGEDKVTEAKRIKTEDEPGIKAGKVKGKTSDSAEAMPRVVFEEVGQEEERSAAERVNGAQELSDELERLSFRYGRGMEEWLA